MNSISSMWTWLEWHGRTRWFALGCFIVATLLWILSSISFLSLAGPSIMITLRDGCAKVMFHKSGPRLSNWLNVAAWERPEQYFLLDFPFVDKSYISSPQAIIEYRGLTVPLFPFVLISATAATLLFFVCRMKIGRTTYCGQCGYDIRSSSTGNCPECGTLIPHDQKAAILSGSMAEKASK